MNLFLISFKGIFTDQLKVSNKTWVWGEFVEMEGEIEMGKEVFG
jgi:hypothetical protein